MDIKRRLETAFTPERSVTLLVAVLIGFFFLWLESNIGDARYHRIAEMPAEIKYQIHDLRTGRSFYTMDYTLGDDSLITAPSYWYFDGLKKTWEYFPVQFRLAGGNFTVDELDRKFITITVKGEIK